MVLKKKILILADNDLKSSCLESPLRVAGHEVHCRKNLKEAINFCQLGSEIGQKVDLLIVDAALGDESWLENIPRKLVVEHLLMVGDSPDCSEIYCIFGKVASLSCPSALLAVVNDLIYS
jgi:hypothetical protein